MELKVKEYQLPSKIEANFEELKNQISEKVGIYKTMVYTDDQIKEAKADKASLNKLKKALNDERLSREREYMAPFNEFKTRVNEIIKLIDEPVTVIDKQIQEAEENRKQAKMVEIEGLFNASDKPEWVPLKAIFNEKWLNATYKVKDIKEEMTMQLTIINNNVETLNKLPEFGFEATEEYKRTLDFNKALLEGQRLADIQRRKEEMKKAEELRVAEEIKAQEEENKRVSEMLKTQCEEEKKVANPVEETKEPVKALRTFSGFLTDAQAEELLNWATNNGIVLMEV